MVSTAQAAAVDLEPAIKELAQGYDLTVRLHCILLAQKYEGRSATLDLVEKILQAFKSSLAVLKPHTSGYTRFEIKEAATASKNSSKNAFSCDNGGEGGAEHSRKRKGINEKSYKTVTSTPHHDGYQWRKYGEKKIRGTIYPRCYYRCTYLHDQHCQAIKQIQQLNSDDPPLYEVTYNRNHTCMNRSSSRRNGEDPQNKDGFPNCIVFGENEDEDDDVTIVSSSSTNSKEIDPAQLRHSTQIQDASKRAKTSSLTLGMGPTQSTVTTVTPAVSPPLPPAVSQPISDPAAFMRRLEAAKRARETPVISPTPLSVAGPSQFSVVGPSQFASLPGGNPGLDPSLLRHLNQAEAAKRLRTGLCFSKPTVGPTENAFNNSSNVNINNNNNVGQKPFPPFTFLSTRFEKMMSQNNQNNNNSNVSSNNNSNIESLFTLPSERLNSSSVNRGEGNQNPSVMERSSAARVRRSFSDNGNQMERFSAVNRGVERSLSQSQMETAFRLSPNRNTPHHHRSNNNDNGIRKEMEGFYTLSSMESSCTTNVATNPNKQMESVSRSSMERSSDSNPNDGTGVRKNLPEDQAEPSENKRVESSGVSENKEQMEGVFNPSRLERNSEKEKEDRNASESKEDLSENQNQKEGLTLRADTSFANPNPNSNLESSSEMNKEKPKVNEENEMESVLTLSSMERSRSADTNMNSLSNKVDKNKNSVENQSEMESMLRLSSLARMPNTKPKETRVESENREEMESFLSLSSMKKTSSCSNLKTQNQKEMEGMLSLSLMESHSTGEDESQMEKRATDVNGEELDMNLSQKKNEMEGVLSLSSMDRSSDPQPTFELNLPLSSPPPPPPPSEQNPNNSNQQNPKPNEQQNPNSELEATVAELRSKLDKSKEESMSTKEKVSSLEAQIAAIKAATEAWQKVMAEEASRRVAEAVSQIASSLASSSSNSNSISLLEGSRRTEILFPGAVDEDESLAEVPSLLSQLDKNQ